MSFGPPGAYGTMIFTGLDGYVSWAFTEAAPKAAAAANVMTSGL